MHNIDLEKNNRENYRQILDVLSMPGTKKDIDKVFDSYTLAIASVLLYSEVSYFNNTNEDFSVIDAITNTKKTTVENADYLFCDKNLNEILEKVKKGTFLNPDYSCTIIYCCDSFDGLNIILKGPGINIQREESYPIDNDFIKIFKETVEYPLGNEIFFLNKTNGEIKALSRTTKLELV